jgi:hypothetical protein
VRVLINGAMALFGLLETLCMDTVIVKTIHLSKTILQHKE